MSVKGEVRREGWLESGGMVCACCSQDKFILGLRERERERERGREGESKVTRNWNDILSFTLGL